MRRQLRPLREPHEDAAFYAERYPEGYVHRIWPDHVIRVQKTVELAVRWVIERNVRTIVDLSCGDGAILDGIADLTFEPHSFWYGDVNGNTGIELDYVGPIEKTLDLIDETDMFVLSETIEHVHAPDLLLSRIRRRSKMLVMSTPVGEDTDGNPEHYWGWDVDDVREMLMCVGWNPLECEVLNTKVPGAYVYQIWICD
jgi:hypothetical protein